MGFILEREPAKISSSELNPVRQALIPFHPLPCKPFQRVSILANMRTEPVALLSLQLTLTKQSFHPFQGRYLSPLAFSTPGNEGDDKNSI